MNRFIAVLGIVFLFALPAQSQLNMIENIKKSSYVYLFGGVNQASMTELNKSLSSHGFPRFENPFYSYGIGYHYKIGDIFILRLAGRKYFPQKIKRGEYLLSMESEWIYAEAQAGWVFFKKSRTDAYVMLGGGLNIFSLKIYESQETSFDSLLMFPKRGVELSGKTINLSFSAGVDYFFGPVSSLSDKSGIILGLNTGYRFTPYGFSWETPSFNVSGGPMIDLSGVFIEITAGWGEL
ncbi:hypothetical protein JW890_03010 [candidate division WOR-3 bacterium]|nr:hypothetical protein [candidate division WOR-3 bacterium]